MPDKPTPPPTPITRPKPTAVPLSPALKAVQDVNAEAAPAALKEAAASQAATQAITTTKQQTFPLAPPPASAKKVTPMIPPTRQLRIHDLGLDHEKLRLIVYGAAGVGKSTLAMSAPRPVVIDIDEGLVAIAARGVEAQVIEVTGHEDLQLVYHYLKEHPDMGDTIVIDSISELAQAVLGDLMEIEARMTSEARPLQIWVPEQGEYMATQRMLHRWLKQLRSLNKHIILTAGVRQDKGKFQPDVSPGILGVLHYWSSIMGELIVVEEPVEGTAATRMQRYFAMAPRTFRVAKNRFTAEIGGHIQVPDLADPDAVNPWDLLWKPIEAFYQAKVAGKAGR